MPTGFSVHFAVLGSRSLGPSAILPYYRRPFDFRTFPTAESADTEFDRWASAMNDRALAIIPARGGSNRIPRKNIRIMSGMPLIYWAVRTALASDEFERIIVSTDDAEIAAIAIESGAEVPFTRSADLADDFASTISVVADAIRRVGSPGEFEFTCCIYPSGIFATKTDLIEARRLLETNPSLPYVAPVLRYSHPIQRALEISEDGKLSFIDPAGSIQRTQDLATRFHDAGQFYMGRTEAWLSAVPILENAIGLEMPSWGVVDIDNEDDWIRAQELHRIQLRHHESPAQAADPQMH